MAADTQSSGAADAGAEVAFNAPYAPPDEAIAASLMAQTSRAAEAERRIDAYARHLIEGIRANAGGLGGIEDFLHAYSLSTREGLALMQSAQETFDKLGNQTFDAAKDATGAVIGLPNARVVSARERCAPAQNGSPDCQTAADTLCRGKGFQSGKSLDTQSELKCPAKILLERRTPSEGECPTEIFVTRAMCQ